MAEQREEQGQPITEIENKSEPPISSIDSLIVGDMIYSRGDDGELTEEPWDSETRNRPR